MFSAEQTNPYTHSSRFQATEIREDATDERLERAFSHQRRARNSKRKLQHSLVICRASRKRALRTHIHGRDVPLAYRHLRVARPRFLSLCA